MKIFSSNVKSVLLYGCETWKVTKKIINSLQAFINKCLRRILRIFWPTVVTNEKPTETTQGRTSSHSNKKKEMEDDRTHTA
jgi:hypothetical protein